MSETTENTEPQAETQPEVTETDWRSEARKWEARAKANKEAAAKLAEMEEAQKTEQQRLVERAEQAEKELAQARQESLRLGVIAKYGIPADLQHLVTGSDEESLTSAAETVAKLVRERDEAQKPSGRVVIPSGDGEAMPLNGDQIEDTLRRALGIN